MNFPFVSRKKYDHLMGCYRNAINELIKTQDERDAIIGNACALADREREDRKLERSHFEAILTNIRGEQ